MSEENSIQNSSDELTQKNYTDQYIHVIQICSVITHGRVLNGELYAERFQKLSYSAYIYRLFHEDFSSIIAINTVAYSQPSFVPLIEQKSSQNSLLT